MKNKNYNLKLINWGRMSLSLMLVFCLWATNMFAQGPIGSYSWLATTGTYANLTFAPSTAGPSGDDAITNATLPFTFTYNGATFTSIDVCTNGWISFNTGTFNATFNSNDFFDGNGPNYEVAGWHGDGNSNGNSSITSGMHPSLAGIYVIQYKDVSGSGSGSSSATNKINHQIWLFGPASSAPGRVELWYGSKTGTTSTGRALGIEDAIGGSTHYVNGLDGLNNSITTSSAFPVSGTVFQFNPPAPLACPVPQITSITNAYNNPTWTASVNFGCAGCTGSYIVEYGASPGFTTPGVGAGAGVGGTVVVGAGSPVLIAGLSSNTAYNFYIRQNCTGSGNGFSPNSSVNTFTTGTPPPANDDCAGAITISCATTPSVAGTTINSTVDVIYTNCGAGGNNTTERGVWYKVVGDNNAYTITTCDASGAGYDSRLTIYSGSCGALNCLSGNDDMDPSCANGSFRSEVSFNAVLGTDYYVFVHGYQSGSSLSATGSFILNLTCSQLCSPIPLNEMCSSAQSLNPILGTCAPVTNDNHCASPPTSNPTCYSQFSTLPDVWYSFTATGSSNLLTITYNTATLLGYALYEGSCASLTQLDCNSGIVSGDTYTLSGLVSGNTYYIQVLSTVATAGSFSLCVKSPAPPPCVAAPTSPTNNGTVGPCGVMLSWPAVAGVTGYDVYLDTLSLTPATTQVAFNQAGTSFSAGTLTNNTLYYWKVVPIGGGGAAIGCTTFSFTTTVNDFACTNISGTQACEGQDFTLTANTTGGGAPYSYVWDDGLGGFYPDASTITLNLTAGNYDFNVTVTDGCGGNCSMMITVEVQSAPGGVASGPATGFTGSNLQYIVNGYASGSTFQWQEATSLGGPYSDITGATNDTLNYSTNAGGTIYIQVIVSGSNPCTSIGGPITTVLSLPGDNICSALPLSLGINGPYSNDGATVEAGEPAPPTNSCSSQTDWCGGQSPSHSVWFTFVAPTSGVISLHFQPGDWDSEIALWSAADCNALLAGNGTLIAANDDSSGSPTYNAFIDLVCVVPGQTYFVQVDGYGSATNAAFSLELKAESVDDNNVCTIDYCDPILGLTHDPISVDDNDACTDDFCDPITGVYHTPTNIDDGIDCTADACDPITGITHTPILPSAISGTPQQCVAYGPGGLVFGIPAIPGGTVYNWSVPAGLTIVSGQGTNQITVSWNAAASNAGIHGQLCVNTSNICGNGQSCVAVDIQVVKPVQPNSISGSAKVCPGDIANYSVAAVTRATSYAWTVPTGMTINTGQGTNSISVLVDANYTGGVVTVSASNICGSSPVRSRNVTLNIPLTPGSISGPSTGLCNLGPISYSIAPVAGASSYLWTVINGTINGSNTGTSLSVNWGAFTTGSVSVVVVNGCGTSNPRTLQTSGAPGTPGTITGATNVCAAGIYHYSIATVPGASSYQWTVPNNTLNVAGNGTKEIDVTHGLFAASNLVISVSATNSCGTGSAKTLGGVTISYCPRLENSTLSTNLYLYPNPAKGSVNVLFDASSEYNYNINIVDITGRSVMNIYDVAIEGKNQKTIDLNMLSSGIYYLIVNSTEGTQQVRLVVE